jgi:hypothetical protein
MKEVLRRAYEAYFLVIASAITFGIGLSLLLHILEVWVLARELEVLSEVFFVFLGPAR